MRTDRRVQRTCELLQKAMIGLIHERSYDTITITDIVERAKVGRTTFYSHYSSKEALFVGCHEAIAQQFHFGPGYPLCREEVLSLEVPSGMTHAYRHLIEVRPLLFSIFQGKDSLLILRRIRDSRAQDIEVMLRTSFAEATSVIPVEVLANYLAGAQIALVQWWLEHRQPCTPEALAQTFHRLQRAAILDTFTIKDVR